MPIAERPLYEILRNVQTVTSRWGPKSLPPWEKFVVVQTPLKHLAASVSVLGSGALPPTRQAPAARQKRLRFR